MEKPSTVFVRNGDESGTDPWDDTLLVEAYNKSVEGLKKTIAEKITMTNGDCNGVTDLSSSEKLWKAGEFCRSIYSEDGIEYEAKILRIFLDGTCIVKYCGYDNEEIVTTKSLKKTAGKQARIKQRIAATESENLTDTSDNYNYANLHMTKIFDTSKTNRTSPIPGMNCIPPPPPPNVIAQIGGVEGESDALSSMLMSWYMSGYHTGYYNALMQTKKQCKKTNAFIKGKKPQKK